MKLTRLLTAARVSIGASLLATAGAAFAQVPVDGDIGFQAPATETMDKLVWFHDKVVFPIITVITLFVLALMIFIVVRFNEKANPVPSKTSHNTLLEVIWTIVPVAILLALVVPAMNLLYWQDALPETDMTIKVTGNTWNWEYSYPDHPEIDSYISNLLEKEDAKAAGKPYLLGADAPLVVPVDTAIKVLVTSNNNIHSFAVPSFGVKMDAIPGRINETWFKVKEGKEGTYYGQCSEICGVRHAFMPIEVQVVSKAEFAQWVANGGAFTTTVSDNQTAGGASAELQQ